MKIKGYKFPTPETATTALQQINNALNIPQNAGIITGYTDYTEIQGDYYIFADARIIEVLGEPTIYEIEIDEEE